MGLLDFLFRKQRRVEAMVHDYLDVWEECVDQSKKGMDVFVSDGLTTKFLGRLERTHESESRADDYRRDIEYELYGKALLPESRGDILGFLEQLDKIPNRVETILYMIATEGIELPRPLGPGFQRYVNLSFEALDLLLRMARGVFRPGPDFRTLIREVDDRESACDRIKRELLREISSSKLESYRKVSLRDLVLEVGELTDLAENVADRMMIMSMKRRV
jgi:predicted phosphate transport protein (TIGR00153 family)